MSEENRKSRKNSQPRKISIQRALKMMCLVKLNRDSSTLMQAFAQEVIEAHPKVQKTTEYKLFEKTFGVSVPVAKKLPEKAPDFTKEEKEQIKENVKALTEDLNRHNNVVPKVAFKTLDNPPPLPKIETTDEIAKRLADYKARAESAEAGIDQVSEIALGFKADMMVERQESKLMMQQLKNLLPQKITEALEIAVEKIESGRDLRKKQMLHALRRQESSVQNH